MRNSVESFSFALRKGFVVLVGLLIFHLFFKAYGTDDQEADSIDASDVLLHVNGTDLPDLIIIKDGRNSHERGETRTPEFATTNRDSLQTILRARSDNNVRELGEGEYINPAVSRRGSDTKKFQLNSEDSGVPELVVAPTTIDPFPEGEARSFTVKLSAEPSSDVTVRLTEDAANIVPVSLNKTELSFTTTNWNTTQEVTMTHTDDNAITWDGRVVIYLAPSGGVVTGGATVELLFQDKDKPELVVVPTTIDPFPEGEVRSFTYKLSKEPSGSVTVRMTEESRITGSRMFRAERKFTTVDWNKAHNVELNNGEDDEVTGDYWRIFYLEPHGGGMNETQTVKVSLRFVDNDKRTVTLSTSPNPVAEGSAVTITATLSEALPKNVPKPLTIDAGTAETGDYAAPSPSASRFSGDN